MKTEIISIILIVLIAGVTTAITVSFVQPAMQPIPRGDCVNGRMMCNGNQVVMCHDREWRLIEQCAPDELCDPRTWDCVFEGQIRRGSMLDYPVPQYEPGCAPYYVPYRGYEVPPGCQSQTITGKVSVIRIPAQEMHPAEEARREAAAQRVTAETPQRIAPPFPSALLCPKKPARARPMPKPPYATSQGDCGIIGKEEQVKEYLSMLQETLSQCKQRSDTLIKDLTASYGAMKSQVSGWKEQQPKNQVTGDAGLVEYVLEICLVAPVAVSGMKTLGKSAAEKLATIKPGYHLTSKLEFYVKKVSDYCADAEELSTALIDTCGQINSLLGTCAGQVTAKLKKTYISALDSGLKSAESQKKTLDSVYPTYVDGIGNLSAKIDTAQASCAQQNASLGF
jgi:hypothetical protein